MKFGTAIHLGVEAILTGSGNDVSGVNLFALFWNLEKTKNNKYGRYGWQELLDQGVRLLERFERLHAKHFVVNQMEQRLYGRIDDIKVEGTPDFLGLYKDVETVVDFKTSGSRYDKEKIKGSEQLHLYSYLASQTGNFQPKQIAYVVFVKGTAPSIQCLVEPLHQERIDQVLANVRQQAKDIEYKIDNNTFTRNYANCTGYGQKCSFYGECYPKSSNETD